VMGVDVDDDGRRMSRVFGMPTADSGLPVFVMMRLQRIVLGLEVHAGTSIAFSLGAHSRQALW
jgi:hypothetical protein